jgi:hypothetical protein
MHFANNLDGCPSFTPIQTSQPSPTVLTYNFEDGEDTIRITKGDKTLSLENIWASRPCSGEYRDMSVIFTNRGFNPNAEIPFTQENLDLLSDLAFAWLLDGGFFIKAEEEGPTYRVGQWFEKEGSARYLICRDQYTGRDGYLLVYMGHTIPGVCSHGYAETMEELSKSIVQYWSNLKPIDSPLKD